MDVDSPENSTGSNEAAKALGMSSAGSMGNINIGGNMVNGGVGLANGFGMTTRPMGPAGMMGSMGMGMQGQQMMGNPGVGAGTGPQEWEWLTMSL